MKPIRKLKKPQSSCSKFELEEIIGLTVRNANGFASSGFDSKFAYTAGCVAVLYDVDLGTQSHFVVSNRLPKPLACVAVSHDGSYIAAGESGKQSAVIVWSSASLASISELNGHRYGVACTAFSPDGKHLVSVGTPQDGYLCLWDWRSGTLIKKLKTCSPFSDVASVSFSADGKCILTAGKKHIKIWTVGLPVKSRAKTEAVSLTMHGKHVNLGHHKGCTFTDIASPVKINGNVADVNGGDFVLVYALTSSGVLCVLHGGLTITQSVNLMVEKGYALSTSQEFIACACNNGIVKLYTVGSLEYAGDLHYSDDKENKATFPDAIACHFSTSEKLVVVYRNQSLYVWNIHGKFQATKCCVLVSHSGCIWDIKNLSCENMHDPSLACVARGCTGGVSFATCSADGTIRLWDLALQSASTERKSTFAIGQHHVTTEPLDTLWLGAGTFERESVVSGVITKGYRSMAVSSDGKHLAAGDSDGNLHIFNLYTSDYTCIQDVHVGEVLSLNFSVPVKKSINSVEDSESYYFLASSGRDKTIHLFDVNRNFHPIARIDDHSAAVSSVKLTGNGHKIISCGSDRSLIFHEVAGSDKDYNISDPHQQKASHGTIYDIAIDPTTETAVTVGQDKKINILDIAAGQVIRSFKQGGDFGDPNKVCVDPSCSYVVCSYSDKSICMYDITNGEMVARATGHGEAVNGIIFLPDCKHLVSVGSDGCIFVWKVPVLLTSRMLLRIKESSHPLSPNINSQRTAAGQIKYYEENYLRSRSAATTMLREGKCPQETPTFRFSISRLPQWAKSKVTSPFVMPMDPIPSEEIRLEDHSPSKSTSAGNAPMNLSLHTPSNHNQRSSRNLSDPSYSKDSTTQATCRSFALDRRWFTIHTVCLDLLNSPEAYNVKERMVPLSSDLSQSPALEETEIELMEHSSMKPSVTKLNPTSDNYNSNCDVEQAACVNIDIKVNGSGCLSHHALGEELSVENSKQLRLSTSVNEVAADNCFLNSGNNSAISKSKLESPKSSARKSYSARFTVWRDLVRGQTLVVDSPIMDLCQTTNTAKEISLTKQEDSERGSSNQEGTASSNTLPPNSLSPNRIASQSNSSSSSSKSTEVKTTEIKDQQVCDMIRNEKHNIFDACVEALRSLDASSKTALEVCSRLRDVTSTHENSAEASEAQFCAEAAVMLPSIARNVQEIVKFASSCGVGKVDIPGFEPLLGKFAESLSQRVIELLKESCTSS
ncbi:WD repeat-containing protein 62 isoform X2 [Helianthus annuus]|uniref:WD repeat-containing protein 62 isoform X2 n=1 Tax=Helianthus annuus TaxID=4232 RepID=UPI000B8FD7B2|nr:WD repeat-containing protein 62 isoform X2 [Helianthus annuus]